MPENQTYITKTDPPVKFEWKVRVYASRTEKAPVCPTCNGTRKVNTTWGFGDAGGNEKDCPDCFHGTVPWSDPDPPKAMVDFLQQCLVEYIARGGEDGVSKIQEIDWKKYYGCDPDEPRDNCWPGE